METRKSMARPAEAHAEPPVLRDPLLGDVQLGHDLDAADDGGRMLLGDGHHGRLQHAVDAVLDHHLGVPRLDMDVRRPPREGIEDGRVHETHDGRGVLLDLVHRERFVVLLVPVEHMDLERLRGLLENALAPLPLPQRLLDGRRGAHRGPNGRAEEGREHVDHRDVERIRHDEDEPRPFLPPGQEGVAEHELHRNRFQDGSIGDERAHVDVLEATPLGEGPGGSFLLGGRGTDDETDRGIAGHGLSASARPRWPGTWGGRRR